MRAAAPALVALTTWRQRYFHGPNALLLLLAALATAAAGAAAALHLRAPQRPGQAPSGEEL